MAKRNMIKNVQKGKKHDNVNNKNFGLPRKMFQQRMSKRKQLYIKSGRTNIDTNNPISNWFIQRAYERRNGREYPSWMRRPPFNYMYATLPGFRQKVKDSLHEWIRKRKDDGLWVRDREDANLHPQEHYGWTRR